MANYGSNLGFLATDETDDVKALYSEMTGTNYDTLKSAGAIDFQVSAGKELMIAYMIMSGDWANVQFEIGYGDNAVSDSVGGPTNYKKASVKLFNIGNKTNEDQAIIARIPAEKYPCIYCPVGTINQANFAIYGVEK